MVPAMSFPILIFNSNDGIALFSVHEAKVRI
jgi:hypothetical protein